MVHKLLQIRPVAYNFSFLTTMPPHLIALVQLKKSTIYLQSFIKLGKLYIVFNEHCKILGSIKKGNFIPTKGQGNMLELLTLKAASPFFIQYRPILYI